MVGQLWQSSRSSRPPRKLLLFCYSLLYALWPQKGSNLSRLFAHAQEYRCHPKCATCHLFDYDMSWHCVECSPGYDLWVDGCFLPCPLGQYRYGYECMPCTAYCNRCVGTRRHECLECSRGWKFDMRGLCLRECEDAFFPSLDGSSCGECNPYCRTCLSEYRISCTSCYAGYKLRALDVNTSSGECMQICPEGYFRDSTTDLRCIQCGENCVQCDSLENCSRCEDGSTLHRGLCYPIPDFVVSSKVDFDTYMDSGAGLSTDLTDPSRPSWKNLMDRRRLAELSDWSD